MTTTPTCEQVEGGFPCGQEARFAPAVRVWAKGEPDLSDDNSVSLRFAFPLCRDHARDMVLDDLITDKGWMELDEAVRGMGRIIPCRLTARLEIESLNDPIRIHLEEVTKKEAGKGTDAAN